MKDKAKMAEDVDLRGDRHCPQQEPWGQEIGYLQKTRKANVKDQRSQVYKDGERGNHGMNLWFD